MGYMRCLLFVYVLGVALAGCVSGAPTQYAQGVPVAPRAPVFSPTLDAPITVGQPGYVGPAESLPRSPHHRVLPPTREPGLWAGDRSVPTVATEDFQLVLDVALPLPDPVERPEDLVHVAACRVDILKRLDAFGMMNAAKALVRPERRCLVARLYDVCASGYLADLARKEAAGEAFVPLARRTYEAVSKVAKRFRKEECPFESNPRINAIALPVERRWEVVQ